MSHGFPLARRRLSRSALVAVVALAGVLLPASAHAQSAPNEDAGAKQPGSKPAGEGSIAGNDGSAGNQGPPATPERTRDPDEPDWKRDDLQLPPPPPEYEAPTPTKGSRSRHFHDGFFLRMMLGLGVGGSNTEVKGTTNLAAGTDIRLKHSGLAQSFAFMIGGSIQPGVVIGGALLGTATQGTQTSGGEDVGGRSTQASLFGGFVEWYPDPEKGLHLGGGVGIASFKYDDTKEFRSDASAGFGGFANLGYEWWTGAQWSLGAAFLGQLLQASTESRPGSPTLTTTHRSLTLNFVATYH